MRTAMSMMLSSSGVHMSPFLLPAPRYAPPAASQLFSVRGRGLGPDLEAALAPRRFLGGRLPVWGEQRGWGLEGGEESAIGEGGLAQ